MNPSRIRIVSSVYFFIYKDSYMWVSYHEVSQSVCTKELLGFLEG